MINISEICIGNILHPDGNDETLVATVRAVEENKISFYEYAAASPAQTAPVVLSEIWLKGYSFLYDADSEAWSKGSMHLQPLEEGGYRFSLGAHSQILSFVHQLQNIFFTLFNEHIQIEIAEDVEAPEVQLAADSIMVNYLPKDRSARVFSFSLTVEGASYEVHYEKDAQGYWVFYSHRRI